MYVLSFPIIVIVNIVYHYGYTKGFGFGFGLICIKIVVEFGIIIMEGAGYCCPHKEPSRLLVNLVFLVG